MMRISTFCGALLLASFTPAVAQVLTTGDFESGSLTPFEIQAALPDSLEVVSSPVRFGRHAVCSRLRSSDPLVSKGRRAELTDHTPVPLHEVRWYGLSVWAGDDFIMPARTDGVCFQFHQHAKTGSPVLAFRLIGDAWKITTDAASPRRTLANLPFGKNRWTDWVIRVRWSNEATGEWTIWKDGVQVVHETNVAATRADETAGPYAKFGQYHTVDDVPQNVLYFDEYRLAGPASAYGDVAPGNARP
jgi:hypothetical protein